MNYEIRFPCPKWVKEEVEKMKEVFKDTSLRIIGLLIFEFGLQNLKNELYKGDKILKVESLPSKNIQRIKFEEVKNK